MIRRLGPSDQFAGIGGAGGELHVGQGTRQDLLGLGGRHAADGIDLQFQAGAHGNSAFDLFDKLLHEGLIGGRSPSDQLGPVRAIADLHVGKRSVQQIVGAHGAGRRHVVDDDFRRLLCGGLCDHLLHGLADRSVVIGSGPDGQALHFLVDADSRFRSDGQQELRDFRRIGGTH